MKKNIFDFSGGYNDTVYNLNLKDNEFSEFYNVDPLPQGGFKVRNGCKCLNTTSFPGKITQMIEWKLRNGATKTIVISDRKLYVFSSVSGEWEPVKNADGEISLENDTVSYTFFRDFLYFCDGEKMYRWNDEVFYLSNLDEYEHHFKKGDIIKLTVSHQESLFRGEKGVLMDVRNQMLQKFSYAWKVYLSEQRYLTRDVYKVKYKFVNTPAGNYEAADGNEYNEPDGIYALHYSSFTDKGAPGVVKAGYFTDLKDDRYPFYGTFQFLGTDKLDEDMQSEIEFMESDPNWGRKSYMRGKVDFCHIGNVGDYYEFLEDAKEFYPHNYNYQTNTAYLGKDASLRKFDENELVDNILEIEEFPRKVAACKYFCFYAKRQRFLASGNPEDPTAIYVSKLGTFEEWDDFVTIYPDCHLGAVTGLYPMNDDIVVCFENGFSYLDSELLLADGSEAVVEYIPRISSVPVGVSNGDTYCAIPQGIVFYHGENIYLATFSLFGKNYVKMPTQNEFVCLSQNKCENILKGSKNHCAVYHQHKYYLYFTDAETRDRVLVYDFSMGSFRLYGGVEISGFISKEKDNILLISSGKYILSAFADGVYTDEIAGDKHPINFAIRSKYYDIGYDFRRLQLKRLYLLMNRYDLSEENKILISLLGDTAEKEIEDVLSDGVLWKNSRWDAKYSWNQDFVIHAFNLNFRTNMIGFYLTNDEEETINAPIVFYSFSFHYDKLSEDVTKLQDKLEAGDTPTFLNWDDQR